MPPISDISYYPSRNGYYTWFRDKQIKLAKGPDDKPTGPTYLAALRRFTELMELANADSADQGNTVRLICDLYGKHLERNDKTATLSILLDTCASAVECFGDKTLAEFKVFHVTEWLEAMATPRKDRKGRFGKWGETYQAMALRTLISALNWAKNQGLITRHCLDQKGVLKKRKRSRGVEAYIQQADYDTLIAAVNPNFGDLIRFLHDTGCRPAEAYHAEARYYRAAEKVLIYPGQPKPGDFVWKNARKTGRDRVIYLNDDLVKMIERRMKLYPEGPLFRTKRNRRWSNEAVSVGFRWYAKKLSIVPAPTAYGFRHSFATDWLLNSGPIKVLADMIGTSVTMIEQHYGHLQVDKARMRTIMVDTMARRGLAAGEKAKT
ncbi:MAG TPA: tyrosine-type recombinase/integrase [Pirellulales bacterium]|nr:tyrosine-type recombinase/integrase [Pirellulales bacterium]